jgi:hypothetical protein
MTHQKFSETIGIASMLFSVPCFFLGYFQASLGLFVTGSAAFVYSRVAS